MKRFLIAALAVVLAIGVQPQAVRAQDNGWNALWTLLSHGQDPRLAGVGIGVGVASTAASYAATAHHHGHIGDGVFISAWAVTSFGCAVVYPMVGTIVLNRPLTPREAYTGMADCVLPFIGGWLVDAALPHDAWTDGLPPPTARRHHQVPQNSQKLAVCRQVLTKAEARRIAANIAKLPDLLGRKD